MLGKKKILWFKEVFCIVITVKVMIIIMSEFTKNVSYNIRHVVINSFVYFHKIPLIVLLLKTGLTMCPCRGTLWQFELILCLRGAYP